jgi:hypothetical protein
MTINGLDPGFLKVTLCNPGDFMDIKGLANLGIALNVLQNANGVGADDLGRLLAPSTSGIAGPRVAFEAVSIFRRSMGPNRAGFVVNTGRANLNQDAESLFDDLEFHAALYAKTDKRFGLRFAPTAKNKFTHVVVSVRSKYFPLLRSRCFRWPISFCRDITIQRPTVIGQHELDPALSTQIVMARILAHFASQSVMEKARKVKFWLRSLSPLPSPLLIAIVKVVSKHHYHKFSEKTQLDYMSRPFHGCAMKVKLKASFATVCFLVRYACELGDVRGVRTFRRFMASGRRHILDNADSSQCGDVYNLLKNISIDWNFSYKAFSDSIGLIALAGRKLDLRWETAWTDVATFLEYLVQERVLTDVDRDLFLMR